MSLDASAHRAFVSLQSATESVAVIDTDTNALLQRLPVPVAYWTAADPATHQVYFSSHASSDPVYVYDSQSLTEKSRIQPSPATSPYGLAVDSANGRLYVARLDGVLIVSAADNSIRQLVELPGRAFGVAAFPEQRMAYATGEALADATWVIGGPMARVTADELVFPKWQTQQTGFVDSAGRLPLTVTGVS